MVLISSGAACLDDQTVIRRLEIKKKDWVCMKKVLFIVNPKSGKGTIRTQLLDIVDIFNKNQMDVTVYITQGRRDARRIAMESAEDYELVVCSGGDGTLNEVIGGVMEGGYGTPVGYIPAGSTNDFANSLGLPRRAREAARVVAAGTLFNCDMGGFNQSYFIYIAAFGLFTDVAYQTNQDAKNVLGHMAYLFEGAKRLFSVKSYHMLIRTRDHEIEGDFIYGMITNSKSVGGFKKITGKDVFLDDGMFEVTMIHMPFNALELQDILTNLITGELKSSHIETFKSDYVELISKEPVPWTLDGEDGGCHEKVEIMNHQQAIPIVVKKEQK